RVDQKPLSVARHGIGRKALKSPGAELEEWDWHAYLEALAARRRRSHQLPVSGLVEQLPPVPPPAWIVAPAGRDLSLAATLREALHIDLIPARRIRGVSQPSPVWREPRTGFIRSRLEHGRRLRLATPVHWQDPDIRFRLRIGLGIDDEAPVPRPVGGRFEVT